MSDNQSSATATTTETINVIGESVAAAVGGAKALAEAASSALSHGAPSDPTHQWIANLESRIKPLEDMFSAFMPVADTVETVAVAAIPGAGPIASTIMALTHAFNSLLHAVSGGAGATLPAPVTAHPALVATAAAHDAAQTPAAG